MTNGKLSLLVEFFKTKQAKEIMVAHLAIILFCGVLYLISNLATAVLGFAGLMMFELFAFQTLWIYRENIEDKVENPIRNALLQEFKTIIGAVIGILVLFSFLYGVYLAFGINPFTGLFVVAVLMLFSLFAKTYAVLRIASEEQVK